VPFHGNSDKTLKNRNWINPYESNQSLIDSCSSWIRWISRHKSWMPHACNTLCHVQCEARCLKIESCWLLSVGFLMKAWNTCQFWVSNHLFLQFEWCNGPILVTTSQPLGPSEFSRLQLQSGSHPDLNFVHPISPPSWSFQTNPGQIGGCFGGCLYH
jgi:hypothetical protein